MAGLSKLRTAPGREVAAGRLVPGRRRRGHELHQGQRPPLRYLASELTFPDVGQYTSPEPHHRSTIGRGFYGPQAFAYAAGRPLVNQDPDGLDVFAFDEGIHQGVGFTLQCNEMCEKNPQIIRIDFSCLGSGPDCMTGSDSTVDIRDGSLNDLTRDGTVIRCDADCDATLEAFEAAEKLCYGSYSILALNCRSVVAAALEAAGCEISFANFAPPNDYGGDPFEHWNSP